MRVAQRNYCRLDGKQLQKRKGKEKETSSQGPGEAPVGWALRNRHFGVSGHLCKKIKRSGLGER